MSEAVSCGGVIIFRGKILVLYKNMHNKYEGWVLPKGTVEEGESHEETALREVREEASVNARILKYVGSSKYTFTVYDDEIKKEVRLLGIHVMVYYLLYLAFNWYLRNFLRHFLVFHYLD